MFAVVTHVSGITEFECMGDLRIWDGGVSPKNIGRCCGLMRCCWTIYEWLGGGSNLLGEVVFIEEGKFYVTVSDGPFS